MTGRPNSDDSLSAAIRAKAQPVAALLAEIDGLRRELAEAKESYSLANQRILQLLDEKIALKRERDELAAKVERLLQALTASQKAEKTLDAALKRCLGNDR